MDPTATPDPSAIDQATPAEQALADQPLDMSDVAAEDARLVAEAAGITVEPVVVADPAADAVLDADLALISAAAPAPVAVDVNALQQVVAAAEQEYRDIFVPPELAEPVAPRDFKAEVAALRVEYDGGLDQATYDERMRDITLAEGTFNARHAMWEDNKTVRDNALATKTAAQKKLEDARGAVVAADWDSTALAFETTHAAFFAVEANKLALQKAIAAIDDKTGGKLSPVDLINRASSAVFKLLKYDPATVHKTPEQLQREAIATRTPKSDIVTLGAAPAAGGVEAGTGTFARLDSLDISELEDSAARLNPRDREAWLAASPGSTSTGREA